MKRAGLLGHPLGHTLSPILHEKLSRFMEEPIDYKKYDYSLEELEAVIPILKELDGFNVTIPHKLNIQKYLDDLADSAKKHGAVNVIAKQNGKHIGYNTDCIGFLRGLETVGIEIAGSVCVVGVGGAGRMFATECAYRGCQLTLAVRSCHVQEYKKGTHPDLQELAEKLSRISGKEVQVVSSETLSGEFDLLINASPVGMYPHTEAIPVPESALKGVRAVFDCIYNPRVTQLMKAAKRAGCCVCGGMPMLVWQAAAAQEIWYGKNFTNEQVEQVLGEMEEVL